MDGWMEIFKVEKLRWIQDERKVKSRGKLWMDGWMKLSSCQYCPITRLSVADCRNA